MISQGTVDQFVQTCQPGDCLFWWGTSLLSKAIENLSKGPSHVAMVRRIDARTTDGVILIESTQIPHFIGVVERPFSDELASYRQQKAQGMFAPISEAMRSRGDWNKWGAFADSQVHHDYATLRMVTEAYAAFVIEHHIPVLDMIAKKAADSNQLRTEFCSQLWCGTNQSRGSGILSDDRDPALTAPLQAIQAAIYGDGMQILGSPLTSDYLYNTVQP